MSKWLDSKEISYVVDKIDHLEKLITRLIVLCGAELAAFALILITDLIFRMD